MNLHRHLSLHVIQQNVQQSRLSDVSWLMDPQISQTTSHQLPVRILHHHQLSQNMLLALKYSLPIDVLPD
ncbi:hypothetical protein DPMN_125146 [Dreissena polymorpha]|uniref:Uncharacterized protein n=1 Tax=Dreissena polymorpha TaxID=45954 RepID=A0A9D4GWZ2_DREPO|nr:hypothetical protein DPMN_125146 [Dreissena polymorpha]